jgi:hemerythrin-like domain-containing protein
MGSNRREFLLSTAALGVGALAAEKTAHAEQQLQTAKKPIEQDDKKEKSEEEVGATEDLMREHGLLNRILLIYEEGLRRLRTKEDVTPELFHSAATLVRKFVEDYHEKLEENYIFPEFEEKKTLVDLVKTLRTQHQAGRAVTELILRNAAPDRFRREEPRRELVRSVEAFIRMYRPHEAREDTVLFPAIHKILPAKQIKDLGEQFEKEEDKLFGEEGFEKTVARVAAIEKELGIYDLNQFTPKLGRKP